MAAVALLVAVPLAFAAVLTRDPRCLRGKAAIAADARPLTVAAADDIARCRLLHGRTRSEERRALRHPDRPYLDDEGESFRVAGQRWLTLFPEGSLELSVAYGADGRVRAVRAPD